MKIYTKTGDNGTTSLGFGKRIPKCDFNIQSLGDLDELNSNIGYLISLMTEDIKYRYTEESFYTFFKKCQNIIFDMGTAIAYPKKSGGDNFNEFLSEEIEYMEKEIDKYTEELPPLRAFILPGGNKITSYTHIVRSVCRRAERSLVAINCDNEYVLKFINRFSDYCFTVARYVQWKYSPNNKEIIYVNWQTRET